MLQIPSITPAVWVYSSAGPLNAPRSGGYAAFLTREQGHRLERIRQARMLYDGKHREYFMDEGRSQFSFPPVQANGTWGTKVLQMYLMANMLKLISVKGADLMFGEEPLLRIASRPDATPAIPGDPAKPVDEPVLSVADDIQRGYLEDLAARSNLHQLFHSKAVDASYEGEAFLESVIGPDGEVYLQDVPADEIFTIGVMGADRQYQQYQRLRLGNVGTDQQPIYLLLKILYFAGRIERHLYQLDKRGQIIPRELSLDQWPLEIGEPPLLPLTLTGIDDNTITYFPNQLSRGQVVSDYDGLIDLQDELNAKQTQIGRVLAKHADPKLWMPDYMANEQGGARADHDLVFGRDGDAKPQYITWNSELAHAFADRDFTREQMLVTAEMSPVLLGLQKQSSRAASYKAIRLESYNSLSRGQRKAMYVKPGIMRALTVCQKLENTLPGVRYDITPIAVQLRDGIPIDDLDQASRQSILRAAGLISVKRAITEQLNDPAAVQDELDELQKEDAAKAPAISFGLPSAGPNGVEGAAPGALDQQPPSNEDSAAAIAESQDQNEVAA